MTHPCRPIALATLCLALTLSTATTGCLHAGPMRVSLDVPAGASIVFPERNQPGEIGPNRPDVRATLPLSGDFEASDPLGYPITLVLPADVAARYGASGEVRLQGRLFVYAPTALVSDGTPVHLPLPEAQADAESRIGMLIRGELTSIEYYTVDPNEGMRRYLTRITLRSAR